MYLRRGRGIAGRRPAYDIGVNYDSDLFRIGNFWVRRRLTVDKGTTVVSRSSIGGRFYVAKYGGRFQDMSANNKCEREAAEFTRIEL